MSINGINLLRDLWWLWSIFFLILSALITLSVRLYLMYKLFNRALRDIKRLFKCNFVILDGLKRLGCNGPVTEEYERMRQHVLDERGYEQTGGKK